MRSAWRTREEKAATESELGFCAEWSKRNHRPINLGAFGAINQANLASRARWTAFVRQTTEKNGMSFAVWSFIRAPFTF